MDTMEAVTALGLVAAVVLTVELVRSGLRREQQWLEHHRANMDWIQYGARHSADGSVTVYPSPAANSNDPVFGRGGANTVARSMHGNTPTSDWRRVYPQDEKALRNED